MKSTRKLLIFAFTFLALAASAYAQPPREQLKQMVQQLQKTPSDSALREKIIKLARTMRPAPALPDTAIAFEGRAQFAFRSAKSENDFLAAAQEYEKAVTVAPWVPGYYSDLCTIYEKAGKYEDAKRHCGFYLTGLTDPTQMTDVKRRIAGLEFGIEKANLPQALVQQLQSKYGNRRLTSHLSCWITDGRQVLTCNESEAQGATWAPGARDGSFSWMPLQTRAGSVDFTSLNIRYFFHLDSSSPNRVVLGWMDDGKGWFCGVLKGAEAKDIEWKDCREGWVAELRFDTTSDGRPMIEVIKGCDAARNCSRDRWVLE